MKAALAIAAFVYLAPPTVAAAETWTGYLVDSKCYASEEQNVDPHDTETLVDRDKDLEIRMCTPNAHTKLFAVVVEDWTSFPFDAAGNAKAAELVRALGKRRSIRVSVTGERQKKTVNVDSLALEKSAAPAN